MLATQINLNSLRKDFERFEVMSHESIPKFLQLTESDLWIIGLSFYQLSRTESYYAEHVNDNGKYVFGGYKYPDSFHPFRQSVFKPLERC